MKRTHQRVIADPTERVRKWYEMVRNNHIHHTMFQYRPGAFIWYKYGSGCKCRRCDQDIEEKAAEYEHSLRMHARYKEIDEYYRGRDDKGQRF